MAYTVKELSKISSVSVRLLHWYDKIGILKPFTKGANNYRYYNEEQLLKLQQILFFKELGFSLNDITKLLSQSDFDNIKSLRAQKVVIEEKIAHNYTLIDTIDKTIDHLRGKKYMKDQELYYGFDSKCQKGYAQYTVQYRGFPSEDLLFQNKNSDTKWDQNEYDNVKNVGDKIHKSLAKAIDGGLSPESLEVQSIVHRHFIMYQKFYNVSKEVYIGIADLYSSHPDFKKIFDVYHPDMIEFIGKAIRYYAEQNL